MSGSVQKPVRILKRTNGENPNNEENPNLVNDGPQKGGVNPEFAANSGAADGMKPSGDDQSMFSDSAKCSISKDDGQEPHTDEMKASNLKASLGEQNEENIKKPVSYASAVANVSQVRKVNFRELSLDNNVEGADIVIPHAAVEQVNNRFANTLYGYFLGNRLAYPIVENYVKNTWGKFGLRKVMMNSMGFFFFKFDTKEVWVKMHDVPLEAFTEDGFSMLATKHGKPGRHSYAKALIEVNSANELRKDVVVAVPSLNDDGYSMETVKIEYEWKPPRCNDCKIFGHVREQCPMQQKAGDTKIQGEGSKKAGISKVRDDVTLSNPYSLLNDYGVHEEPLLRAVDLTMTNDKESVNINGEDDESDVEEVEIFENETSDYMAKPNNSEGASTPGKDVSNSHVVSSKLDSICSSVFLNWSWSSNGVSCPKGVRIIIGWNSDIVDLMVISQTDQVVHTQVMFKKDNKMLLCSFVYAHNNYMDRRALWHNLGVHKLFARDKPWCIMGDFNAALTLDDKATGSFILDIAMREFKECVELIEVSDISRSGLQFTWTQKPKGLDGILKKIDRVMANIEISDLFIGANAFFLPYRTSDHSPAILRIPMVSTYKRKPFKFSNLLVQNEHFLSTVEAVWKEVVVGVSMFQLVKKLKHEVQKALDKDPTNLELREEAVVYLKAYNEAVLDEERFLKQKAKVNWLNVGDSNSAYFHKVVKSQAARSRIDSVLDSQGVRCDGDKVPNIFVDHYVNFLGKAGSTQPLNAQGLFTKRLTQDQKLHMVREVFDEEVKNAIFSMGDDKAPGPDGYSVGFFKGAWSIVGNDVVRAVKIFFVSGKLLKEVNHKIISLLPKIKTPLRVNDFRPISLCNVVFKCITKIIANRIKDCLASLGPPRCAFKVDIQKANDIVDWDDSLDNGVCDVYVLFYLYQWRVAWINESGSFRYHHLCEDPKITDLCFADDLFIFLKGDASSAKVVWEALEEFKSVSGLSPSIPKSIAYFCNVRNHVKISILSILPFEEGKLPVKYLGVPLVSTRLIYRDCKELVERIRDRVNNWENKFLSFAGRLQLVQSVLSSMHIYWSSVFILPARVTTEIEQILRGFLWSQGVLKKGQAKVAWDVVCLPKQEGGLGIRHLDIWNSVLMTTHVWNLLTLKESLRVKWIYAHRLRGKNFWDVQVKGNLSWSWRKLLQIRLVIRKHFWFVLGNGNSASAWYDNWADCCPILDHVTPRMIKNAGHSLESKVVDFVDNGVWKLPANWDQLVLATAAPILVSNLSDSLKWKSNSGSLEEFSVSIAWNDLQVSAPLVDWYHIVWYKQCVPKFSFLLWLVIKRKLKTQDMLRPWDVHNGSNLNLVCPLCGNQPDSHSHLFFDCDFSKRVWLEVNVVAGLDQNSVDLDDIIRGILPLSKKISCTSVVSKLVLATSVYHLWQERNLRLFQQRKRSEAQLIEVILSTIQLKLMTFRFKKSTRVQETLDRWKLPPLLMELT
uniref:uncharacterized protein LOC122610319 n=1 Tax=Erigeron canadensis TaxID=72917 RepID=UPI001CB95FAC|nr:uncharacterized protein LOC122610319 [Erigeron canadensis]